MSDLAAPPVRARFPVIDIARGVAIIAMIIYHLCWDLAYFRFIPADVGYDLGWVLFARSILYSFLFLVGVGIALGSRGRTDWRRFWRRWGLLVLGALAITVATLFAFPDTFVYFGVLHAIALFTLLALPLRRAPSWLIGLIALVVLALPAVFSHEFFNAKPWSWLGFWTVAPPTNDLVPVFPSFGVVLLGLLAGRRLIGSRWSTRLAAIAPTNWLARVLQIMGRWSLLIYLVHQPLLLAVLFPLAGWLQPQIAMRQTDFLNACQRTCVEGGTTPGLCTTYCQCGLETVEANDLWDPVFSGTISPQQQALLDAGNRRCSAVIYPELNQPK